MAEAFKLQYLINSQYELNLSYMPFIIDGGLFIPTEQMFSLGDKVTLELQLPKQNQAQVVEGKVIWITPKNALYHIVQGIGVQFTGPHAKLVREQINTNLDNKLQIGGYAYGLIDDLHKLK